MKKIIIGSVIGTVVGAGAIFGAIQIPKVNDVLVLKDKEVIESPVDTETQNKIENLEETNTKLEENITSINTKLTEAENQIKLKDEDIATKTAEINQLTIEKNQLLAIKDELENKDIPALNDIIIEMSSEMASLKQELDTYKELIGKDITYVEIINDLTAQLESCESDLLIANAELEQLRLDKETLITRVTELEIALTEAQDKLSKYESLEHIDKYSISSFDGTWYKNGTFEDYFIIKDGVVVHNANEDSGVVQNLYNQMYLFMNNSGSVAVELSDDGTEFITADGIVYSIFYVNTFESIVSEVHEFSGKYSNDNSSITINVDNSIEYTLDNNVYHGAFVSSSYRKNIGGNISTIHYVTATIQINNESIIKQFSIVGGSESLLDVNDNIYFSKISGSLYPMLGSSATAIPSRSGIRITVMTSKPITILPGEKVSMQYASSNGKTVTLNGASLGTTSTASSNGTYNVDFYNSTDTPITSQYFDFYFSGSLNNGIGTRLHALLTLGSVNLKTIYVSGSSSSLSGMFSAICTLGKETNSTEFNKIMLNPVNDYINGSYTADTMQLDVSTDTAVITLPETESIVASTYEILSQTDGYDIYQTVTITYITTELVEEVETEITHTIKIDLKNNNVVSSTLDNENIEFSKN